jgi:exodeoxyribonuclease V beta subunit
VALTRAKHRCYLVWGRINETGTSAPAWLFHNRSPQIPEDGCIDTVGDLDKRTATLTDRAMQDDLALLIAGSGGTISFQEMDTTSGVPVPPRPDEPAPPACRLFRGRIDPSWKVASYSLLVSTPSERTEGPDRDALAPAALLSLSVFPDDFPLDAPSVETAAGRIDQSIFHLPGGARTGILVHDILEKFDFTENNPDVIRRLIAGKLPFYGLDGEWEQPLTRMLRNIAACPLPQPDMAEAEAGGVSPLMLSRIKKTARLHELFGRNGLEETGLERLNFNPVEGFMHGFIDLVFAYGGRYYLADWKSNNLGPGIADYAPAALKKAMAAYGYTLQSRLYAVALHQYLRLRLKDYRYDRHFGGIYYLFIRGMDPAYGPACGIHVERPDRHFMDGLCRLLIAGE